jgi:hypothetical protein
MNALLNDCNCCQGLTAQTPAEVNNRPGLSAIAYRVGTQSQFKLSMLAALSDTARPALQGLKTREDDDFSIALLDAAATMADVLTFYQERIANESYLRTATERRSLLELARLIGYELRPGVAASAFLAFTMDTSPGAPQTTTVDKGAKVQSIPGPNEKAQTFETIEPIQTFVGWNSLKPPMTQPQQIASGMTDIFLNGINTQLHPGDAILIVGSERIKSTGSEQWDFRVVQTVETDPAQNRTHVTWQEGLGHVVPPVLPATADVKVYALRQRAGLFGNNAPDPRLLSNSGTQLNLLTDHDGSGNITNWKNFALNAAQLDLDTTYPKILIGSWIVLASPTYVELCRVNSLTNLSRADFALSMKVTRIAPDILENPAQFDLRNTLVFAQSELLEMSAQPITDPISGATIPLAQPPTGLVKGQWLVASGKDSATGNALVEIVQILAIYSATLTVMPPLANRYARDSFSLNANVAHATHGETGSEILGSGDASQTFQQFTLKQSPLTYVSAQNASGAASTLQVRVNGLLWQEVPTLYGRGPKEHIFVTRTNDDGVTTVEFGDGATGACLPTGQNNVQAVYRKGIGLGGLVKAGQLTSLLTRPLGIKSAINPEAATGAQDPEALADARTNAPLTVLTLDRAVSLQDYEDFSRAFAGIAKALATWSWANQSQRVFITVAGPDGAEIKTDSDTYKNLLAALQQSGDPFVSLCLKSYVPAYFRFAGKVKIDPAYETDSVLAAVEGALRTNFSFDARGFGQPVFLSEVFEVIQAVPGVIAATVDKLYRADGLAGLNARLLAALPETLPNGDVTAAELLMLDSAPLDELGVMP